MFDSPEMVRHQVGFEASCGCEMGKREPQRGEGGPQGE